MLKLRNMPATLGSRGDDPTNHSRRILCKAAVPGQQRRAADEPPMNYRHAFHAGNFADVVKHAVLTRLLVHLCGKPAAYRAIDTHAGAGLYDLAGPEAARSGEWRNGIERLLQARIEGTFRPLLGPYLDAVTACNPPGRLTTYPGSPEL